MSNPPTISVIVPTFNGAAFLGETLSSLLAQTEPVHQVVVVDDGSTDGSADLARTHPLAPNVVQQQNHGVAAARNVGTFAATGDYVAFLDHDDLWAPARNARLRGFLAGHDDCSALVTTCTGFFLAEDEQKLIEVGDQLHRHQRRIERGASAIDLDLALPPEPTVLSQLTTTALLDGPPSVTASLVIRRDLLHQAGGFAPFARSYDDYVALLNISAFARIDLVDEPTVLYRVHSGSTTMSTDWPLRLLTGVAAVRHGGRVVGPDGRDPSAVPALLDDRRFYLHQLGALAQRSTSGMLDSLALVRLLGTSRGDRARATAILLRRWLAGRARRPHR